MGSAGASKPSSKKGTSHSQRNDNILAAVLTLIKELDKGNLELVQKEIEKKVNDM